MLAYLRLELVLCQEGHELFAKGSELKLKFLLNQRHGSEQPVIDDIESDRLQISPDLDVFDPTRLIALELTSREDSS